MDGTHFLKVEATPGWLSRLALDNADVCGGASGTREATTRGPQTMAALDRIEPLANPARSREGRFIMRRSFGALAIAALMATAVAIPVAANAEINGHNCIGVAASATEPTVNGPRVAEWNRKNPPGAMARRIAEVRADSDYGCVPE